MEINLEKLEKITNEIKNENIETNRQNTNILREIHETNSMLREEIKIQGGPFNVLTTVLSIVFAAVIVWQIIQSFKVEKELNEIDRIKKEYSQVLDATTGIVAGAASANRKSELLLRNEYNNYIHHVEEAIKSHRSRWDKFDNSGVEKPNYKIGVALKSMLASSIEEALATYWAAWTGANQSKIKLNKDEKELILNKLQIHAQELIILDETNHAGHHYMGIYFALNSKNKSAIKSYKESIKHKSTNNLDYINLAEALLIKVEDIDLHKKNLMRARGYINQFDYEYKKLISQSDWPLALAYSFKFIAGIQLARIDSSDLELEAIKIINLMSNIQLQNSLKKVFDPSLIIGMSNNIAKVHRNEKLLTHFNTIYCTLINKKSEEYKNYCDGNLQVFLSDMLNSNT